MIREDDNDSVFVKITNKDIFDEMRKSNELAEKRHSDIIQRLDITNGKVKLAKWIATTALSVALIAIGYSFYVITNMPK
jgi:hypothetical protein